LKEEAEADISEQRIMRATKRIGQERVAERDAATQAWAALPLPEQQRSPREQVPQVACVEMDGGRLQIRNRKASEEERRRTKKAGFWREDKVGCLLSMSSPVFAEDPCPQIPESLLDIGRIRQIAREIKGFCVPDEEESAGEGATAEPRPGKPEVLVRSVVATREDIHAFGNQLAAAAWQRGFSAAPRKAFVGDGQEANWTVWRRHFSHYTPILDFIHAVCYVFAAAVAGRPLREAAPIYRQWAQWMWSGEVPQVIAALRARQQEIGLPEKDEEESPRAKVADALRYLENQKSRMRYDEYRRLGLPITSSHIESTIKQINRRVKGTEKFWSEGGAEALLQLAADYLSETNPLATFWRERPGRATGQRHYQAAA
jgi:HAMP domain-containing protein